MRGYENTETTSTQVFVATYGKGVDAYTKIHCRLVRRRLVRKDCRVLLAETVRMEGTEGMEMTAEAEMTDREDHLAQDHLVHLLVNTTRQEDHLAHSHQAAMNLLERWLASTEVAPDQSE